MRGSAAGAGVAVPGAPTVVAWTPSGSGPREARSKGLIAIAADRPEEALAGADLVVLAAPPLACLELLDRLAGDWRAALSPDATVTDVSSTKAAIVVRADERRLRFVGGHPMAGDDASGFGASRADLFDGRPWVVVPGVVSGAADTARVEWLAAACRARPVRMDAADHDAAVAGISHLPLVLAAALVEAVAGQPDGPEPPSWAAARGLAAGGWASMTRLARGDPAMGAGILATNAGPIAGRIRDLQAALDRWHAALEGPGELDARPLEDRLRAARERLGQERPGGGSDGR